MNTDNEKTVTLQEIEPVTETDYILRKNRTLMYLVAIFGVVLDQVTKIWVSNNFIIYRPVNLFGSYLRLVLVHNSGLIWGLPIKTIITYYILPIAGIIFILFIAYKNRSLLRSFGFGLIIAGAIGNLIDRFRLGYVVDFLDMGYKNLRWATYNFADASIVIGITIVLAYEIFKKKRVGDA